MITRFIIYGLLGWSTEVLWTGLCSISQGGLNLVGHTSVWMFFIYGSAVFLLEPIHNYIVKCSVFARGCVWTVLIFLIELISGAVLRVFGIEAWYYSGRFAVLGLIRLDYLPLWFALGLVFEKIHSLLIGHKIGIK